MPANKGLSNPNWHPRPDFKWDNEDLGMKHSDYVPSNAAALARFFSQHRQLPEMEPYEHDRVGRESVAQDIAERIFQPGVEAEMLVALYLAPPAASPTETPAAHEIIETVYVVTQTPANASR